MTASKKRDIDRHDVSLPRGHEAPKLRRLGSGLLLSSTPPARARREDPWVGRPGRGALLEALDSAKKLTPQRSA